jgi:hypothetical protein
MDKTTHPLQRRTLLKTLGALGLTLPLGGCGYLLYPERRGNTAKGQLDLTVVVLDAVLVLFFVIPGVIAFVIDINSGCIYLRGGMAADDARLRRRLLRGRRVRDIEAEIAEAIAEAARDEADLFVLDPAAAPALLDAETLDALLALRPDQPVLLPAEAVEMDVDDGGQVTGFRVNPA